MSVSVVSSRPTQRLAVSHFSWSEWLVYGFVLLFITIRFFTERIQILPRFLNAIDLALVPVLWGISLLWVMSKRAGRYKGKGTVILSSIFAVSWILSWAFNTDEVHWLGALLLIGGLSTPIMFYLTLINLGLPLRFCYRLLSLLDALLVVNLVIATFQAAIWISPDLNDFVFGTFGVNQNQLAFFLALMMGLGVARWIHKGLSFTQTLLVMWSGILFLLSGFQTLWVVVGGSVVVVLIISKRVTKRLFFLLLLGTIVTGVTLSSLKFERFSLLGKLNEVVVNFDELGKVQLLRNVGRIWQARPGSVIVGVGPGTFNSRAFRSIAIIPYTQSRLTDARSITTDVAGSVVTPFYVSTLSQQFIIPYFERGRIFLSGVNTDGPFTSYVSIPVEVGVPGALAFLGIYMMKVKALVTTLRRGPDSHLRVLATWAMISMMMLLGIALVDNYLETTRYTLLAWLPAAASFIYASNANGPAQGASVHQG